jgi:peptidoglycan/xylan/chitin deacetylase (PgdA/CDA1 family)
MLKQTLSSLTLLLAISSCASPSQNRTEQIVTSVPQAAAPTIEPSPEPTIVPTATLAPTMLPTTEPTAVPTEPPTLTPTASATAAPIEAKSYIGYRVREGDTLASIAADTGSTPELITSYNILAGEPQPGRELIIPQVRAAEASGDNQILVIRGNTAQPWVALTFDCGFENRGTTEILDTLKQAGARTTFFVMGYSAALKPEIFQRVVADGHEIASHAYSHTRLTELSDADIGKEMRETEAVVQQLSSGAATTRPFMRPPYGDYNARVLRASIAEGYLPIYWTLDVLDTVGKPKSADFLVRRMTEALPREQLAGSIILAHCTPATAEALPIVLERYREAGLEVRPLSDVLGP